jgi:hypothetical protein
MAPEAGSRTLLVQNFILRPKAFGFIGKDHVSAPHRLNRSGKQHLQQTASTAIPLVGDQETPFIVTNFGFWILDFGLGTPMVFRSDPQSVIQNRQSKIQNHSGPSRF